MKNQKLNSQQNAEYDDYSEYTYRTREEKMRNKRKERRIEHALRTKNMDELLEVEDDWEE
jgi:hypothetical protein